MKKLILKLKLLYFKEKLNHANILLYKSRGTNFSTEIDIGKKMRKKKVEVCYKYKDGRFLKTSYMGDGDYEVVLTTELTSDCLFTTDWPLSEILDSCDGIYDDSGEHIGDTLDESDFIIQNVEVKAL